MVVVWWSCVWQRGRDTRLVLPGFGRGAINRTEGSQASFLQVPAPPGSPLPSPLSTHHTALETRTVQNSAPRPAVSISPSSRPPALLHSRRQAPSPPGLSNLTRGQTRGIQFPAPDRRSASNSASALK